MKQKITLLKLCLFMVAFGLLSTSSALGQATLKHSYTFEDGTANDGVGGVNGTLVGSKISIADGMCTVAEATANTDGYLDLDGAALNLNTYGAITLEAFLYTEELANTSFTMLAYFGNNTGGNRCFWIQPTRNGNETRIEANNGTSSITALLGGTEIDDGKPHHLAAVLSATSLIYYIDGVAVATTETGGDFITTLDTEIAHIFKGANGWADPNYNASLDEFNIYDGEMDAATIKQRAGIFLGADFTNATLDTLFSDIGVMDPAFDSETTDYQLTLPYGVSQFTLSAIPTVSLASVTIYDGLGNEMPADGVISFTGDGIDLEIIVLATDEVTEMTYYVSVFLEEESTTALLTDIQLSAGVLTTDFLPLDTGYVARVPLGTTSVDVTGVAAGTGATVVGGGTVALTDGKGFTTITVTSEDGNNSMVYTVDIYETKVEIGNAYEYYIQQEFSDYVVAAAIAGNDQIKLAGALKDEDAQLWHFEESGIEGQYYIKNKLGLYFSLAENTNIWNMTAVEVLPQDKDTARFQLNEFEPGRFIIESIKRLQVSETGFRVGPNNGNLGSVLYNDKWISDEWTPYYTWRILPPEEVVDPYNTTLDTLTITNGDLLPAFDKGVKEYAVLLEMGTTSVTIGGTATDPTATVSGTGTFTITEPTGSFTVTVSAPEPQYKTEYVITYILMVDAPLNLEHSYTFADGTARDVVAGADGALMGGGNITEGVYTAEVLGDYIDLPAGDIAINTYPSITLELYLADDPNTTNTSANTMTAFFGFTNTNTFGNDYLFASVKSRAAISCKNPGSPWAAENGADGADLRDDGAAHHIVTVVNNDSISLYIDGLLSSSTLMSADNKIFNLSNALAYICKSGYSGDNTWLGQVMEYNIYSGQMDAQEIALRSLDFPVEDATTDATLSALTLNGDTIEGFHPANLNYVVEVEGDVAPTVDGITKVASANYVVNAASGVPGTATVEVTAADGTTKNTYTIEFSAPNAAGDVKASAFKVYPTFSKGEFTIETSGKSTMITVYDMSGRVAKQLQTNSTMERISLEQNGMYIVKIESEGNVELFKVFKKN